MSEEHKTTDAKSEAGVPSAVSSSSTSVNTKTDADNGSHTDIDDIEKQKSHVQATSKSSSSSLPDYSITKEEADIGMKPGEVKEEKFVIKETTEFPSGLKFAAMTFAVMLAIGVVALDSTIVSTAVPTLVDQWHSLADMGWYGSAFLLPQPVLQPSFGKAYPFGNTKYIFLFGLGIFEVGSLICSLANSSVMFIIGRAIAGMGGAAMAPGFLLILTDIVPRDKRPMYTGLLAASAGTFACLGPILGGIFTTQLTWRWCFWINIPIGVVVGAAILFIYSPVQRTRKGISWEKMFLMMDPIGCVLITGSALSLLLALTFAAETSWSEAKVIILLVLFVVLLVALGVEQAYITPEHALIPKRIIKNRGIQLCTLFGFLVEVGSTGHVYYLPFYFQGAKHATAEGSGVDLLPYLLAQTVAGIIAGILINRTGFFNPPMLFGTVLFSIGAGLLTTLKYDTPSSSWIGFQVLAGFGTGCAQFMAMGIAQQLLQKEDESIGLSMVYMIKTLGGSVSVSICSTIFYSTLKARLAGDGLTPVQVSEVLLSISNVGDSDWITGEIRRFAEIACSNAINHVFYLPVAVGVASWCVAMLTEWRKIQKVAPGATGTGDEPTEPPVEDSMAEKITIH